MDLHWETCDHFKEMWSPVNAIVIKATIHEQLTPTLSLFFLPFFFFFSLFAVCVCVCLFVSLFFLGRTIGLILGRSRQI